MRSTLDAFLAEIYDLTIFVDSIKSVNKTLAGHKDAAIRECLNIRRRLDYSAFIISLYTALERFVEDIVWSHAELESSKNKYSDLCEELCKKNLIQSGKLIIRRQLGKERYAGVTERNIIENLHKCLSDETPYRLNRHAVTHHDQNLKSNVLAEMFGCIGVKNINDAVCRIEKMKDWYRVEKNPDSSPNELTLKTIVEMKLKDLVDRRNQVSHAGRELNEYFDDSEMKELLLFFKAYVCALFDVLAHFYIDRYWIKSGKAIGLNSPIRNIYKEKEELVAVIGPPSCKIFQGQPIVGVNKKQADRYGYIKEIQVNDSKVPSIDPGSIYSDIGLRTDFKFTHRIELYVLQKKDDAVWS